MKLEWPFCFAGVDFNIEAADDIEDSSNQAYLDNVVPPEQLDPETCNNPELNEQDDKVATSPVVNGFTAPTTPPTAKKKRLYNRKLSPRSEGPVVKLLKLSPNTIARHTNGEMRSESVPSETENSPAAPTKLAPVSVPHGLPKKRTVNGPNLLRNKQLKKKVVGKSKAVYRKPDRLSDSRTSLPGVKPLDPPVEESDFVECVKCLAVVNVLSARDHVAVCPGAPPLAEIDLSTTQCECKMYSILFHFLNICFFQFHL